MRLTVTVSVFAIISHYLASSLAFSITPNQLAFHHHYTGANTGEFSVATRMAKEPVAEASSLTELKEPLIIDVRDDNEKENNKGGAAIPGSVHVPINIDGQPQSVHETSKEEFAAKLKDCNVDLDAYKDNGFITHCGKGGRGGRAAFLLKEMGYKAFNGGSPDNIRSALDL